MTTSAIVADNLTMQYPTGVRALSGVSFEVKSGEITALIGPNGAGKTTTLNIIMGLLAPTAGSIYVYGVSPRDERAFLDVKRNIGFVPQENAFDYSLSLWDNLDIFLKMYGISKAERRSRISRALKDFGLWEKRFESIERLSGGMIRRAQLARAFAVNPKLLILDEPTVGLDPQGRKEFWENIRNFVKESERTVLWTTHYLEEVEQNADKVILINRGKKVLEGSPRKIKSIFAENVVILEFDDETDSAKALNLLGGNEVSKGVVVVMLPDRKEVSEVFRVLADAGIRPYQITLGMKSLEDIYLEVIQ